MGLSVKATLACNLGCVHCYENASRTAGNAVRYYDLEAMRTSIVSEMRRRRQTPVFHGGEPLLMPIEDMRSLCETIRKTAKAEGFAPQFSIQTNGLLITDRHIRLFKHYGFSVGVSIDGPGPLNRMRQYQHSDAETDAATDKIIQNLHRLRRHGLSVGLITVLHRLNALPEQREALKTFYREMKAIGIKDIRTNPMILDDPDLKHLELTPDELAEFFIDMSNFSFDEGMNIEPYRDVVDGLLGMRLGTCIFGAGELGCDPLNTRGEEVIYGDGSEVGCQKTSKDGTQPLRMDGYGQERSAVLRAIPTSEGGCGGCPYWAFCGGGCPSEGEGGDWRAKTRYCSSWFALYHHVEKRLKGLMPNIVTISDYVIDGDPDMTTVFRGGRGVDIAFARMRRRENIPHGSSLGSSTWIGSGTWNPPPIPGYRDRRGGFWTVTHLQRLRSNGYTGGSSEPGVYHMIAQALKDGGLPERPVILELGCGDGLLLEWLAWSRFPGLRPAGVDLRGGLIAEAERWQPEGAWVWSDVRFSEAWPSHQDGWDAVIIWPQYFGGVDAALKAVVSAHDRFRSPDSLIVLAAQNDHTVRLEEGDGPQAKALVLRDLKAAAHV